jgi:hypothetical protein
VGLVTFGFIKQALRLRVLAATARVRRALALVRTRAQRVLLGNTSLLVGFQALARVWNVQVTRTALQEVRARQMHVLAATARVRRALALVRTRAQRVLLGNTSLLVGFQALARVWNVQVTRTALQEVRARQMHVLAATARVRRALALVRTRAQRVLLGDTFTTEFWETTAMYALKILTVLVALSVLLDSWVRIHA